MKQTEHFGFLVMEATDQLSPKPLNENVERLDEVMGGMAEGLRQRVMMAMGSYTGDGTASVTIRTPGFRPAAVFVRQKRSIGISSEGTVHTDSFSVDGGWVCWMGEESLGTNVNVSEMANGTEQITFTAETGGLSWTMENAALFGVERNINNAADVVYEWIAFGYGG